MAEKFLARHTTASLRALLDGKKPVVALIPVGSTEPHGPHLGLGTDVVISAAACVKACEMFERKGPLTAVVAPAIPYGVTECATGFAGAVSVPAAVLTAYAAAACDGLLASGIRHVCLVNNHLEPAHDAAIRAVLAGREGKVSVACPLTKKWARTLSAEFKSGACHAGQYETSIMMAAAPEMVDEAMRSVLAEEARRGRGHVPRDGDGARVCGRSRGGECGRGRAADHAARRHGGGRGPRSARLAGRVAITDRAARTAGVPWADRSRAGGGTAPGRCDRRSCTSPRRR